MTSLELFHAPEHTPMQPPEWGTGKYKEEIDLWVPRDATWKYSGEPIKQHYGLTQLKLSHVRSNDELVPRPQALQIGYDLPNKAFPAEHPYQSHIPRFAVFPKFDSPEDPKRGVAARSEQPISSEMPANSFDITVKEKTKGSGLRHELQALPTEGAKQALYWPGEDFFDQQVKVHGARQQFYPMPPKTITPNLQTRDGDMRISAPTANALRNIERAQWMTSHQLDYTGLGPSNPLALDNIGEKYHKLIITGQEDEKLYPHFINTFDPPRGMEGRLARKVNPASPKQRALESGTTDNPEYKRKMTLTEREEHRLLHGTEYVNLPDTSCDLARDVRWRELDTAARAGPALEKIEELKQKLGESEDPPYPQAGTPPPSEESYLVTAKAKRDQDIQEIEAKNRWKLLELQTPSHDQTVVNKKMEMLSEHEKPHIFYNHEGRYNEERAGLYKTSYDPYRLAGSMNTPALSSPEIMNTLDSSAKAQAAMSLQATRLADDNRDALKWSRTFSLSQPELSGDRQDAREVLQPYRSLKQQQRSTLLPPGPNQARALVQEKELLQKEATTMGDSYNVKKFLQDNTLDKYARSEPLTLMSSENQSLSRVRSRSLLRPSKNVQFSRSVTVATMSPESTPPINVGTQLLSGEDALDSARAQEEKVKVNTTQYTSTHALYRKENDGNSGNSDPSKHATPAMFDTTNPLKSVTFSTEVVNRFTDSSTTTGAQPTVKRFQRRPITSHGQLDSEYTDQFRSLSSNFLPTGLQNCVTFDTSYESQFPVYNLNYKRDLRFDWEPGCGFPRPQTSLLRLQDTFVKSDVRKRFHSRFPETNPELRFNISTGKKHNFFGFNAQVIHG